MTANGKKKGRKDAATSPSPVSRLAKSMNVGSVSTPSKTGKPHVCPGDEIIAQWPRNRRDMIRVTLGYFNGYPVVSLRCWYQAQSGEWRPGKDGLSLSAAHLHRLRQAFARAEAQAIEAGMIGKVPRGDAA